MLPNSPNSSNQEKKYSYIQRSVGNEAYLIAQTIRTGVLQTINLPPPVPENDKEADEIAIVRVEVVRAVAKRRITLNQDLKKGFATVYDQCSKEVRDLHELILKIERIYVGFDNHKQEVYNLVQAMKTLFLYTQQKKSRWKITPAT